MKDWQKILTGVGAGVLLAFIFIAYYYGEKKGLAKCETEIATLEKKIDSINALPPVIVRDTFISVPDPVVKWHTIRDTVRKTVHVLMPDRRFNIDSLVNDELAIYVRDSLEGAIFWRQFGYKLFVPKTITYTDTIFEKVPLIRDRYVDIYHDGLWIGGKLGGGSQFAYTVDLSYSLKRHQFGVEYLRFGPTNNWLIGYKYLIFQKK